MAVIVLIVGIGVTTAAAMAAGQSVRSDRERRFDTAAERARSAVGERIQVQLQNQAHIRNWMWLNPHATREEFERYTALGFAEGLYPGVQAISFAPAVPRSEVTAYEAAQQAALQGIPDRPPFEVHPTSDERTAYPVTYLQPYNGNEAVLGFDLATDASRRVAIEAARDRGTLVGSGPVRLVQGTDPKVGFIIFSAVYDSGGLPATEPARRRHFIGVASVVFRVGSMLEDVLGTRPAVELEVYDIGPTEQAEPSGYDPATLLYNTKDDVATTPDGTVEGLHRELDLNIGDRRWRVVTTPSSAFPAGSTTLAWVIAALGGMASMLLAGIVQLATRGRGRAERRATEMTAEVRAAEQRTRSIIEGAPDAMLVVNGEGRITSINLATESLFGYAASELIGESIEALLPEDLRSTHLAHRARFLEAPRRREMGAELELLGRRRDGTTFSVEVSLSPLVAPDRTPEVIAAVRDVSERSRARAALQAAYDNERRTGEELREAFELKATFLNTISHELRTPLTAISGFTELILTGPLTDEQREDYVQRVRRNAQSLSTLIAELLAFAQLESHQIALRPNALDLGPAAREIADQIEPIVSGHSIVFDVPSPSMAFVDLDALTRILTNLLSNAARYAPRETEITIAAHQRDDRMVLAVSDQGPGIPDRERSRVFEQFFRGATALASGVPGTGVGLAVVRELAQRSGGSVRVTNRSGGGARFEVDLPAAQPD